MSEILETPHGRFTVDTAGPTGAPLVLLLHGFPQSRHSWRAQLPALADAGFRAIAPDQRGYSPGARPLASDLAAYALDPLVVDAIELADAAGAGGRPFHLVGHDWGGQVAWRTAEQHPARIATLSVLSRPHPEAFRRALHHNRDGQADRSSHHRAFLDPETTARLLANGASQLRGQLAEHGVSRESIEQYLGVLGTPPALEAALAWYRAMASLGMPEVGPIRVSTLYLWGEVDHTVGPTAARGTAEFIAAPYQFEPIPGVGHYITDHAPELVNRQLLAHLRGVMP